MNFGISVSLLVELDNSWAALYNGLLSVPHVFLHLRPEDDGEQGEHQGCQQSQVRVEQHSEDERHKPDHLQKEKSRARVV